MGVVLFLLSLLTGFSALVSPLMSRIRGELPDDAVAARMSRTLKDPPVHKAAREGI